MRTIIDGEYLVTIDEAGKEVCREINPERAMPSPVTRQTTLSKLDYMERFTGVELEAIYTAAKSNVGVEVWLAKFNAVKDDVNLDDPRTIEGVQKLEAAGILAAGRAAEILA